MYLFKKTVVTKICLLFLLLTTTSQGIVATNPLLLVFDGKELVLREEAGSLTFGKVKKNAPCVINIRLENHSTDMLVISNIRGSCGLSIPAWPRRPILPGESANIQIRYDSSRVGVINRNVVIQANTFTTAKVLKMEGEIVAD